MNDLILSTCNFEFSFPWKNFRTKTFCFLLYKEWSNIDDILKLLIDSSHTFLAISPLHDSDLLANGKPDKPHYHGIISFDNQRWAYSFVRHFGISCKPERLKDKFDNRTGAILYLTHSDDNSIKAGKVQYPFEEIYTDHWDEVLSVYNNPLRWKPDAIAVSDFLLDMDYLIKQNQFDSELQIAHYCSLNGTSKLFHQYRYQIHSDFVSQRARLRELKYKSKNSISEV